MPSVTIKGPLGNLEGRYHAAESPTAPVALVLHPNPQFGGSMNNMVVYTMFTTFVDCGFSALRFNYRGVGRSEGQFSADGGEVEDAVEPLDWLQAQFPNASAKWVGGFSYGAMIALKLLAKRKEFAGFIAVSPPAKKYDFTFLDADVAPGLFLHGEADTLIPPEGTVELVERLRSGGAAVEYIGIPAAGHFFDNQQEELTNAMRAYLAKRGFEKAR
ncbi:MAG: alpha/beta fold hydrolase [Verrucomicrobiota bacterium]